MKKAIFLVVKMPFGTSDSLNNSMRRKRKWTIIEKYNPMEVERLLEEVLS